jgi:hypothetical protein
MPDPAFDIAPEGFRLHRVVMVRPRLALAEFVVRTVRPVAVKQQRGVVVPATRVPLPIRYPTATHESRFERTFSPERPCAVSGPGGAEPEDGTALARTHLAPRQGRLPGRPHRASSMPDPASNPWARRAQTEPVRPDRMTGRRSVRRGVPGPADMTSGLRGARWSPAPRHHLPRSGPTTAHRHDSASRMRQNDRVCLSVYAWACHR